MSSPIRLAIEALPVHSISGHEWDCAECHYHFIGDVCLQCGRTPRTDEGEADSRGGLVNHGELLDRTQVLALFEQDATE